MKPAMPQENPLKHRAAPTLLLLLGLALAQNASPLKLDLTLNLVNTVTESGKPVEKLTPATQNFPGDVLSQVVTVTNTGSKALSNVRIPLNVPRNTVYLAPEKGMADLQAQYSIDGGKTFAPAPLKKTVTVTENGKTTTRQVDVKPSEYQAVRWTVPNLAPGQTLKLGYRIQVK